MAVSDFQNSPPEVKNPGDISYENSPPETKTPGENPFMNFYSQVKFLKGNEPVYLPESQTDTGIIGALDVFLKGVDSLDGFVETTLPF